MTFDENTRRKVEKLAKLIIRKQHDYGPGNILKSPIDPKLGVLVRLNDKLQRAANLIEKDVDPANESLLDTAMDIAGYGMILWMLIDDTFELPLEEK